MAPYGGENRAALHPHTRPRMPVAVSILLPSWSQGTCLGKWGREVLRTQSPLGTDCSSSFLLEITPGCLPTKGRDTEEAGKLPQGLWTVVHHPFCPLWPWRPDCGVRTQQESILGFPGGSAVKNPPVNARDTGSIPDWGTKIPHATEQLSPCSTTTKPVV